jgi:hypothetical protein
MIHLNMRIVRYSNINNFLKNVTKKQFFFIKL